MARGRMLSKSLSTSRKFAALAEELGKLGEFGQALYPLIVTHSDDFGRLEGDPFTIKHLCHPTSPRREEDFATVLMAMNKVQLIVWYEVDGRHYVQIADYERHQTGLHKRTSSRFPDPPGDSGNFPEIPSELKGTELNRTEGKKMAAADAARPAPIPEEFQIAIRGTPLEPLLNGAAKATFWNRISKLEREYSWLHVAEQLRAQVRWLEANPHRKKKNLTGFVTSWLNREIKQGIAAGKPEARTFVTGGAAA